jgi:flagellar protein FliO/FliZ
VSRFFLIFFLPSLALANETAPPGISGGSYVQAVLALGLIIALLLGIAWLARKVSVSKGFGQGGMKVIGGVALGPRERIVLVEVGESWLVIGIVPGQIRTLHTMPRGTLESPQAAAADIPFAQWLKSVTERRQHD